MAALDFPTPKAIAVGVGLLVALLWPKLASAQDANQAGLVIVHGNGQVITRCVQFSEPELSGYDLLQRSGLDLNIDAGGMGVAICRIDNEGCTYPQQSCFCGTEGDSYRYWAYWQLAGGIWQYANLGASNHQVQPGTVEGWIWGTGNLEAATPPPLISLAEICAPPTASPTPAATSTPLPTATATATAPPSPTATATPPPTATPLPPHIEFFTADPSTLTVGETVLLRWAVVDATSVLLRTETSETPLAANGELRLAPPYSLVYLLVARNSGGESATGVNIIINPPTPLPAPATATPLPSPSATATPLPTVTLPPTPTWTITPLPTATPVIVPPTATAPPTTTAVPSPTALPTDKASATFTPLHPTFTATTTPIPLMVALAPGRSYPPPPTAAVNFTQQQIGMLLAAVGLVVALPLGLFSLAGLIWLLRRRG